MEKPQMISIAGLKARGWTQALITLLGEPDVVGRNSHYAKSAPMRLYDTARVASFEVSSEFLAASAARHLYNACLQECLRRLDLMKQSKAWQAARAVPATVEKRHNKARSQAFRAELERFGFTSREIEKHALSCRNACWIGDHLGSHDTQTTSLRAFRAAEQYAFGKRGRQRFKSLNRLNSIEGKADAVIRYRAEPVPAVHTTAA